MTGPSSSSTWLLPLVLLPGLLTLHLSSSAPVCSTYEFNVGVGKLEKYVKNCSRNCSSSPAVDKRCRCLHLNISHEECGFPHYFTDGLRSLNFSIDGQDYSNDMRKALRIMKKTCKKINFCSLLVTYEPVISPASFFEKLKNLSQLINSMA